MVPEDLVAAIRKRPGMYIGAPDPHRLLWELVANCVDLELAGRAIRIDVELHADGSASVRDDGPGIGLPLEQLFVEGHTTPTADGHAPHVHLNLHGVGAIVVSALSERVEVRTRRGDVMVRQEFARGVAVTELMAEADPPKLGTSIRFWPDPEIFGDYHWDPTTIEQRLREFVALRPQLSCGFVTQPRWFPESLDITNLLPRDPWHAGLHERPFVVELTQEHATARVALRWLRRVSWSRSPCVRSFCNLIETTRGAHLQGFERGVGGAVARAAPNRFWNAWRRAYQHVAPCLVAVVAVEILDPKWAAPVKDRPSNKELGEVTEAAVLAELPEWFEQHPDVLAALLEPDLS